MTQRSPQTITGGLEHSAINADPQRLRRFVLSDSDRLLDRPVGGASFWAASGRLTTQAFGVVWLSRSILGGTRGSRHAVSPLERVASADVRRFGHGHVATRSDRDR